MHEGPTGHKFMVYFDGDEEEGVPSYQLHPKPWHKFVGRGTKMIVTTEESLRFEEFMKALWQAEVPEQGERTTSSHRRRRKRRPNGRRRWREFDEGEDLDEEESEEEDEEEDTED